MLYTIADINAVLYSSQAASASPRSSNPYDYIRAGYYLDNASLFGGENNVSYHLGFTKHLSGNRMDHSD